MSNNGLTLQVCCKTSVCFRLGTSFQGPPTVFCRCPTNQKSFRTMFGMKFQLQNKALHHFLSFWNKLTLLPLKTYVRAALMMWWACPCRMMWRSAPKSFGRWAVGWTVMWARARCWAFFPPSGACVCLSPGMSCYWCFGGVGPRARDSTPCRGMACSLDLLGRLYMPGQWVIQAPPPK